MTSSHPADNKACLLLSRFHAAQLVVYSLLQRSQLCALQAELAICCSRRSILLTLQAHDALLQLRYACCCGTASKGTCLASAASASELLELLWQERHG